MCQLASFFASSFHLFSFLYDSFGLHTPQYSIHQHYSRNIHSILVGASVFFNVDAELMTLEIYLSSNTNVYKTYDKARTSFIYVRNGVYESYKQLLTISVLIYGLTHKFVIDFHCRPFDHKYSFFYPSFYLLSNRNIKINMERRRMTNDWTNKSITYDGLDSDSRG